ncbi:MAG: HIT family protein [Alphaproteobacteria bacterium]|nr:HIT family protein [Alphaproteobacteria bacterium]
MTDLRECIFCRIVAGTSPCQEIFRDAATLAFMDIHPANDGHCLVIPRRHYENVFDMPPDEFGQVGLAVAKVVRPVKEVLQPGGISLIQANGELAGQTVFHVHLMSCRAVPATTCQSTGTGTGQTMSGSTAPELPKLLGTCVFGCAPNRRSHWSPRQTCSASKLT